MASSCIEQIKTIFKLFLDHIENFFLGGGGITTQFPPIRTIPINSCNETF